MGQTLLLLVLRVLLLGLLRQQVLLLVLRKSRPVRGVPCWPDRMLLVLLLL
jgi:hypothetical protein